MADAEQDNIRRLRPSNSPLNPLEGALVADLDPTLAQQAAAWQSVRAVVRELNSLSNERPLSA